MRERLLQCRDHFIVESGPRRQVSYSASNNDAPLTAAGRPLTPLSKEEEKAALNRPNLLTGC